MDLTFSPSRYAHVHFLLWPWVWWQLFWLRGWALSTGREVLFEVDRCGRLTVLAIGDDHRDARAWLNAQARTVSDYEYTLNDPSGERHLCAVHYWIGRFMECGERITYIWVRSVLRPLPPIADSS